MLDFTSGNVYVKGFLDTNSKDFVYINPKGVNNVSVVITDMVATKIVPIVSVKENGDKWDITCSDNKVYTLAREPIGGRTITNAMLVRNFCKTPLGCEYEQISVQHIPYAIDDIYNSNYRFIGCVNGEKVVTGTIVTIWMDDDDIVHGITKSGTHYIWG